MKYILTLFLTLLAFGLHAEILNLNYTKSTPPFEWRISQIEKDDINTRIIITLQNKTNKTKTCVASDCALIIPKSKSEHYNNEIRPIHNSLKTVSNTIVLIHYEAISFTLTFPSKLLNISNEFSLRIGVFTLDNIKLPLSFNPPSKQMLTWEEYYNANKKSSLTYNNINDVRQAIQRNVENWQKKGEFETTASWRKRVNDKTRQEYITKIASLFASLHENELKKMKQEQIELAKKYELYKQNILDKYYQYRINIAKDKFSSYDFELNPYDADNETFLIHSNSYGDILLPVPIKDAPSFKTNWPSISHNIIPEFVPNGDDVALNKLIFNHNQTSYTYDSHTVAKYAITDINYNFAPIEIDEIDFANIEIDGVSTIPNNTSSSVIELKNKDIELAHNNYIPERNKVSASEKSDVDISIPQNAELKNSTTFAVIIANEKYNNVSPVPYAENDGNILSKYLINSIGLPKEHVKIYNNATFGNMAAALKHINNLSLAFGEKLNLIFYYAGHGVPNEQTKQCMLLPVDGDASIPETCYDVDKLFHTFEKYNANSIIVMMDACFSGSVRGDGMLYASRSVKIKSNHAEPKGNMVVFSASQGDETAYPFDKEQHGMFTYYLLKKLQENKGDVTLGQLSDYLINQVKRQSVVSNGKLQTPTVKIGESVKDKWMEWKLGR